MLSFRMLPVLVVAPVAIFKRLPVAARIVLAILLSSILATTAPTAATEIGWSALAREFFLGVALAFGFHAALAAAHTFGHVLDQQMGFAAVTVFDPSAQHANSLVAEYLQLAVLVGFIAVGADHALLRGLAVVVQEVPPGASVDIGPGLLAQLGAQFSVGFALVAPLMVLMWLIDLGIAMISRAAPSANVYFVAIPLKVGVALCALAWLSSRILPVVFSLFNGVIDSWSDLFR